MGMFNGAHLVPAPPKLVRPKKDLQAHIAFMKSFDIPDSDFQEKVAAQVMQISGLGRGKRPIHSLRPSAIAACPR
jgi:hypothetical protein